MKSGAARRILWIVCLCLLVARVAAASTRIVFGDFDGDGQIDPATLLSRPAVPAIQVWLSTTHEVAVLQLPAPASHLVAADLDGDRRDELIAGGASPRLFVWTVRHQRFERVARHAAQLGGLSRHTPRGVNDGPDGTRAAVPAPEPAPIALDEIMRLRAPPAAPAPIPPEDVDGQSPSLASPFGPRPPPVSR